MPSASEEQEVEALAAEIAADRGVSLAIARRAAREQLAALRRVRQEWDRAVAQQHLQRPPVA